MTVLTIVLNNKWTFYSIPVLGETTESLLDVTADLDTTAVSDTDDEMWGPDGGMYLKSSVMSHETVYNPRCFVLDDIVLFH